MFHSSYGGPTLLNDGREPSGDDGTWHSRTAVVCGGILLPLAILGIVTWRIACGEFWFWDRWSWVRIGYDREPISFVGIVVTLLAAAGFAFVYYVVGNHPRWGWYGQAIGFGSGLIAVIGLILVVGGQLV